VEYYKKETKSNLKWFVAAALGVLFALDLWFVISGMSQQFDDNIMQFAYDVRGDFLTVVFRYITHASDTLIIAIICVVLVVLPTRVKFGIPISCTAAAVGIIRYIIMTFVGRARPDQAMSLIATDGSSFPSGHATMSFVFYLFLMVLLWRFFILSESRSAANLVSVAMPLLVLFIGVSRIYLGAHYATDIIAGWFLGGALLIVILALYDHFYPLKNRITFDAPSWEYSRRRRPWRRPQISHPQEELLDFPKNRSVWRRPGISAKRKAAEEERKRRGNPDDGYMD
jgi:undecaprenyl-diphosphatase